MRPTSRFFLPLLLVAALAGAGAFASAFAQGPPAWTPGVPHRGPAGRAATVSEIMDLQRRTPARTIERDQEEKTEKPDRSGLPLNPASPDAPVMLDGRAAPTARLAPGRTAGAFGAQTVPLAFTGATLAGLNPTLSFPPDCMGAVGPTQFVVFVNGRLVTFNKTTGNADGFLNADPDVFFSPVINGSSTSDPRIRYDRLTGRWFLVIINVSTPNRILIAVSDGLNNGAILPSTTFSFFYIDIATTSPPISNTCFADYPTLGLDANALYIGVNNFCGSPTQTFNGCDGYVVRKSSLLGAGPAVVTVFRNIVSGSGAGPYTPQGVDNFDPAATEGYFIGVDNATFGTLMMRRIANPGGTPSISGNISITVSATTSPATVPHLGNTGGTAGNLSALDDRLYAAHIRNGRLWTAHNIRVNNTGGTSGTRTRNAARWYELSVPLNTGTPTVVQSGTVYTPTGTNVTTALQYFIPSIMVSGQGHAAMAMCQAGTNDRANASVVGRLSGDALGAMQASEAVSGSTTAYNPINDPGDLSFGRRWGDYTYTSLDPVDDMTMWAVSMFCNATDSYGVRVAKLLAPPPATPATIPAVTAGLSNVAVTLTGTSVTGSGFYDPGANLPGVVPFSHLAATILNTGVTGTPPTVVSATYVNPTTVNLVLDATSATASIGAERYTVRVTNPDGQVRDAAILQVLPGTPSATIAASTALAEGNAGTTGFDFTVNLSSPALANVIVRYQTSDGTATVADGDYIAETDSITIPTGQSSGTITIAANGDTKHEANETFSVTLTSATNANLGATVLANGTIQNDDAAPQVSVNSVSAAETNAGTTNFTFDVTLSAPSGLPASVECTTADGTALAPGDYAALVDTVEFAVGEVLKTVTVVVSGDVLHEADETFTVGLANPVGATLATASGTGTIQNDDAAPLVSIAPVALAEGDAGTTAFGFDVTLSKPSGATITVDYATADGTALEAQPDYLAALGTLTFAPGDTAEAVTVLVYGDTAPESNETFTVDLSNLVLASPGTLQATGTIQDDDTVPSLVVTGGSVGEPDDGTTTLAFTVHQSYAVGTNVTVDWQTDDGTATEANGDYAGAGGVATIVAGDTTATLLVTVNGDFCGEPDETFTVTLSNASGAAISGGVATGTIVNEDDVAAPSASVLSPNGGELLTVGNGATITWSASDDDEVAAVEIRLSRDGGATYPEVLATGLANSGSFGWTVTGPPVAAGQAFVRVAAADSGCNVTLDASDSGFEISDPTTAAPGAGAVAFGLGRIVPNPTRGLAQVEFDLAHEAPVRLVVVDTQGREVAVLASGTYAAGRHVARWDGRGPRGAAPVGVYFVRYAVAGKSFTRRLALLR